MSNAGKLNPPTVSSQKPGWLQLLSAVCRYSLAVVWLYSGVTKMLHPVDTHQAVLAYEMFDYDTSKLVALALPGLEIILGVCLLVGMFLRPAAILSGIIFVVFIIGIASAWVRGLTIDCGCFGGGGVNESVTAGSYVVDILRDVGFLMVSVVVTKWPFRRLAVYP